MYNRSYYFGCWALNFPLFHLCLIGFALIHYEHFAALWTPLMVLGFVMFLLPLNKWFSPLYHDKMVFSSILFVVYS